MSLFGEELMSLVKRQGGCEAGQYPCETARRQISPGEPDVIAPAVHMTVGPCHVGTLSQRHQPEAFVQAALGFPTPQKLR